MCKKYLGLLICFVLIFGFFAELGAEESEPEYGISHALVLQLSSLPEAKLGYTFGYKFPFLQGDNPFTKDNNVKIALTAEVSPISLNGLASIVWTPIAFLEISAGGRIGTGWHINLFGADLYGLARTASGENNNFKYSNIKGGLQGKGYLGGAFQFDLAAIIPGDWNHVVFRTYHEINYAGFSCASGKESWVFENDDGDNVNGFRYYSNYLVGYQMPIFLNMIALLAEAEKNLYNIPYEKYWGEDLIQWHFAGILNFAVHKQVEIALLCQFRTRKNFIETDWKDKYYRTLEVNRSNPQRIEFYRVAAIVNYKF
ncbi:MAG: hypothetical protein LBU88_04125 [Treponema sp.]|jgi:hypothetical protein|nr:hypothetical protein [Treponema sp.]